MSVLDYAAANPKSSRPAREIPALFAVLATTELAAGLLVLGVYFYTAQKFGWAMKENFLLAASQGAIYVFGALTVSRLAGKIGRRFALILIFLAAAAFASVAFVVTSARFVIAMLLLYNLALAMCWPVLESLMCSGLSAAALSKRIGNFNLVWAGVCTIAIAGDGWIIDRWPAGVFILPIVIHIFASLLLAFYVRQDKVESSADKISAHAVPEPELRRMRTLALWLSRIALPATYVVIYSLLAMMPSLPVFDGKDVTEKTLYGSVWMAARWATFVYLGMTTWWHARPRILLVATAVMLAAFYGVTLTNSLTTMLVSQVVLGVAVGLIYAASLYFGMVLSDGSTEHGGYHEALIGLGMTLGPGIGAAMQWLHFSNFRDSVDAVGTLVLLTLFAAVVAERIASRRANRSHASVN